MFIAGFTGASAEVLMIFVFQIAFGYIYAAIGILIAVFMSGLALGAYVSRKLSISQKNYRIAFILFILYLLLLLSFLSISYPRLNQFILWPVFIILMLIPSGLTGFIFVQSTSLFHHDSHQSAPAMYAVDLLGSSLGMIIMTLILIPLIGLSSACLFLIILNIIPIVFSFQKQIS
jgi:spermidine synthase